MGWIVFSNEANLSIFRERTEISQLKERQEISLIIDNGEKPLLIFKSEFKEGLTVFDLLKEKTEESSLTLKTKTYEIGVLIEAVGDKENGVARVDFSKQLEYQVGRRPTKPQKDFVIYKIIWENLK